MRFFPEILPPPKDGVFGCETTVDDKRTCARAGVECELVAPPGYWNWGGGGVRCDDACMQRQMAALQERAVPRCACTCSQEYQRAQQVQREKRKRSAPPRAPAGGPR